jgi:hypothetical protein
VTSLPAFPSLNAESLRKTAAKGSAVTPDPFAVANDLSVPGAAVSQGPLGFSEFFSGLVESSDEPDAALAGETPVPGVVPKPATVFPNSNRPSKRDCEQQQPPAQHVREQQQDYSWQVTSPVVLPAPAKKDFAFALPLNGPVPAQIAPSRAPSTGLELHHDAEVPKLSRGTPIGLEQILPGWLPRFPSSLNHGRRERHRQLLRARGLPNPLHRCSSFSRGLPKQERFRCFLKMQKSPNRR